MGFFSFAALLREIKTNQQKGFKGSLAALLLDPSDITKQFY